MSDQNNYQQQNQFQQVPQQPYNVPQQKPKKPIYKKWWFWVLIVIVAIVIISSLGGGSSDTSSTTENNQTTANSVAAQEEKKEKDVIGDYKCVVKKATLCKDYEGKDAVKIVYEFTNNSEEATSFDLALLDDVYQDGVGLETAILSDDDVDSFDVKIKPGVTKEVTKAYLLSDTSTDLTVEIGEFISFDDTKITTTVKITK